MENINEKQSSIVDDERFIDFLTDQLGGIREDINHIREDLKEGLGKVNNRLDRVETTMVTKSFFTDKLADFRVENDKRYILS